MTEGTKNIIYAIFWAASIAATILVIKDSEQIKTDVLNYQIDVLRNDLHKNDSLSTLKFDSLVNSRILKDSVYIYNQNKIIVKYAFKKDSMRLLPLDSNLRYLTKRLTNK